MHSIDSSTRFDSSYQQKRLLQLCESQPAAGFRYNSPLLLRLGNQVDYQKLNAAFAQLLARHEILRTGFEKVEGDYYQLIHAQLSYDIEDRTATTYHLSELDSQLTRLAFRMDGQPLFRAALYQTREEGYLLWLDKHLLLADRYTDSLLVSELVGIYCGQGLDGVSIQYRDYALWQRNLAGTELAQENAQYWSALLQDFSPKTVFPVDYKPQQWEEAYQSVTWNMEGELLDGLRKKCSESQRSVSSVLLGMYYVLLYTLSREEDIVVAYTASGRKDDQLRQTMGYFENSLPLRKIIGGDTRFVDLCNSIEASCRLAERHQEVPAEVIVSILDFKRESREPAFFIPGFEYYQEPIIELPAYGQVGQRLYHTATAGQHPGKDNLFFLSVADQGDSMAVRMEYNAAWIDQQTVYRIQEYYRRGVLHAVQHEEIIIRELCLVPATEKHQLLVTFNNTKADFGAGQTVLNLFTNQVTNHPDAIAVACRNKALRYDQLHALSNQFAHYLQKQYEVKAGDRVGIMANLSEWTLITILGTLKIGAAFVPIDPESPWESVGYKLADAEVSVLVADEAPVEPIACPVLQLAAEQGDIMIGFAGDLPYPDSHALAYVMYTSGTTGRPKGVAVKHASFYNYISWAIDFYRGSSMGNMPLFTSLAFDLTLTSVFLPITSGRTVCVSHSTDVVESLRLAFAPGNGVNTVKLTPSHILMLPYVNLTHTEVEQIITGGEKLSLEHVLTLEKLNPSITIYDEYGPTEATVGCVAIEYKPNTQGVVGRPISNAEIYILDDAGQVLPLGAKGEIYIGGACVAEGYFGQKELTVKKFVPNPFRMGEYMYQTGDLGRWLSDGNLVFCGRRDEQIKFYGNRIEPEEIEEALKQYDGIRRCVVAKRVNAGGEDILVAYYVSSAPIDVVVLKQFLARHLAKNILPTHFVHIRKLPLTLNGKLNYQALPDPETVAGSVSAYVAPQNLVEEKLASIWGDVLGKERIGTRDNFFELGGHSLKATRIVSQIYKEFKVQVPLRSVFNHSTVQALALYVTERQQDEAILEELNPTNPNGAYSTVHLEV